MPDTKTTDIVPYFTPAVPVPSVAPSATNPIPTVQVDTRSAPVASSSHSGGTTSDPPALSKTDNIAEALPVTTTRARHLVRLPSHYKNKKGEMLDTYLLFISSWRIYFRVAFMLMLTS